MEAVGKNELAARPGTGELPRTAGPQSDPLRPDVSGPVPAYAVPRHATPHAALHHVPPPAVLPHNPPVPDWDGVSRKPPRETLYGALDLGTNNCRLLIAKPARNGLRVVDAFSRIIRLGEGLSVSGQLSEAAIIRTLDALRVCAGKLHRHGVTRRRLVATQACRIASNAADFISRVRTGLGLELEILSGGTEAELAVSGCIPLIDKAADYVLVFDIGGGSSELIWLDRTGITQARASQAGRPPDYRPHPVREQIADWISLPVGVVTLAERFGGRDVTADLFEAMVRDVMGPLQAFEARAAMRGRLQGRNVHLLGTSGTVTTIAGIELNLPRYDRNRVDGLWLSARDVRRVATQLLAMSYERRVSEPCIGRDRADLVLAGCAILEALLRTWPCERLRVADRGLREGILTTMMLEDGVACGHSRGHGAAGRPQR